MLRARTTIALLVTALAGCAPSLRGPASGGGAPPNASSDTAVATAPALPPGVAVAPAPIPPAPLRTRARATVGAVGDVLFHEAVKRSAEAHRSAAPDGGYGWLFAPVADLLAQPDVMFANLESPVAPDAGAGTREYVFNAPPQAVAALAHAGVDAVTVANNHAFDQGRAGFEETVRRVAQAGLTVIGAGPEGRAAGPVRIEAGGLTLAFLGYAQFFNQEGNACLPAASRAGTCVQAAQLDRDRAVEDVRAAAASADAVVVSLHWGVEYATQPRAEDVELAHRLVEAGALVILGHHPHVLQPVELYRRGDGQVGVIAYSLGNFVSNQSRKYVHGVTPAGVAATRDGVLLRVALARRDYGRGVVRVEVDGVDAVPLWTDNDTVEIDRKREPDRRPAIRVVAIDRALAEVRADLARLPDPVPAPDRDRFLALRRREALLVAQREAVGAIVGEELLRPVLPPPLPPAPAAPSPATAAP